ncbi:MAG TPA: response regulator, partial [Candidatus Hydrogenedentes bacterium]|nr:response regulator [Candidatus Hydrogenedentota bacterium]
VRRARGERILFVDDEESLALLARMALERSGYRVVSCTKSLDALQRFEAAPQDFDVVITDQTMPDMTGEMLAERMRAVRPDIPIILCTGYSERMDERRAREAGFNGYLEKPFVDTDLSTAIQQALADAQTKAP